MRAPALLLAGTHSGCGKTTLCAGLLRAFRHQGLAIAPFKTGPDYLDPKLHGVAAGRISWNLDGFFLNEVGLQAAYDKGSVDADIGLIEGVMGLFDGRHPITCEASGADLAKKLGVPVVLVLDGGGVGGSIAATVLGHAKLWPELDLAGVILNRVSGEKHYQLQKEAIEHYTSMSVLGYVPRRQEWVLPERHLGIYQPHEMPDLEKALDRLAEGLRETVDLTKLRSLARCPLGRETFSPAAQAISTDRKLSVAIASDEACNFVYADTLDRLAALGVNWIPFSPLRDRLPSHISGIYLPGGYPELHAEALSKNQTLFADLRQAHRKGMPIFAECGGYMLLGESLRDLAGRVHPMAGVLQGRFIMTEKLQSFGYKALTASQDNLLCAAGGTGKAHEFHHSIREDAPAHPLWHMVDTRGKETLEGVAEGNLVAAYAHLHFGAQPDWAEQWVLRMARYDQEMG